MTRQLIRISFFLLALAILLLLLIGTWAVRSDAGRDFLMARIAAQLPAGSSLTWSRLEGTLWDGLSINGLQYADAENHFSARTIRVQHALWPLLSERLQIHDLQIDDAVLILPVDNTPFELPRWPDVLPVLDLPMTIAVEQMQVRHLQIQTGDAKRLLIVNAKAGFTLAKGALSLPKLEVVSDHGILQLHGDYLPREKFHTALTGHYTAVTEQGISPATLGLDAKGDIDDFTLALSGNAPAPLLFNLHLHDGSHAPHWSFDGQSEHLLLEQLGLAVDAPWAFSIKGTGVDGVATLSGKIKRGEQEIRLDPSRVSIAAGELKLAPVLLRLDAGVVRVEGKAEFVDGDPRFDVLVSSEQLRLQPESKDKNTSVVNASAKLKVVGKLSAWTVDGDAVFLRAKDKATVKLIGRGDDKQLLLNKFDAVSATGSIKGNATLYWQPALAAKLNLSLKQFDPGYFFPDFPGALNGELAADIARNKNALWQGTAKLSALSGRLRNRALTGDAQARWDGNNGDGQLVLTIGTSHIKASGRIGERYDVQAEFSPFNLSDISPHGGGQLHGTIAISGPRSAPGYRANLSGSQLRWLSDSVGHLEAAGELPSSGKSGQLHISASEINVAGQGLSEFEAQLTGSLADAQAKASAVFDFGRIDTDFHVRGANKNWQGSLDSFKFSPRLGGAWTLQAATQYHYANGSISFDNTCLQNAGVAQVCAQAQANAAHFEAGELPLSLLEPWLNENKPEQSYRPFGVISLAGDFTLDNSGRWNGNAMAHSATGGIGLNNKAIREVFSYSDFKLDFHLAQDQYALQMNALLPEKGFIHAELKSALGEYAAIDGAITLEARRLSWLELTSPDIAEPKGQLVAHLLFSGQHNAPKISGDARLDQFSAELPALGIKIVDGDVSLQGEPDGQATLNGVLSSGKGQLQLNGAVNLADHTSPLQLSLKGQNVAISNTPQLRAEVSPDLLLVYQDGLLKMTGSVGVPSARLDLERLDHSVSVSSDVVVLDPREASTKGGFQVDSDVSVQLGKDVQLKGFGLEGSLTGTLQVRDQPGFPALATGTIEAHGKYSAYGQALNIKRSRLTYSKSAFDNPSLDILAERNFDEVTIGIRVQGTARSPQTSITSSPAMETSEALSWLVLGRPITTASGAETQKLSAQALAISAGSNLLAQQIGVKLGLDQAGVVESRALGGAVFSVGKKVSPRLFVSYGVSLLGSGQVMTLKYLIKNGFDLSIESGEETVTSLNWRKEK